MKGGLCTKETRSRLLDGVRLGSSQEAEETGIAKFLGERWHEEDGRGHSLSMEVRALRGSGHRTNHYSSPFSSAISTFMQVPLTP